MRAWMHVADLAKPKNLDGGLVARSAAGLPFLLEEGLEVAFVPPVLDAPRRARVASVRMQGDNEALVFFEGVDSIDVSERLAGCSCLARRADVPEEALLAADAFGWEGWRLEDVRLGQVGAVVAVEERPGQLMMLVRREGASADAEPALVPLADELIEDVDEDARVVLMRLPVGLLDL